MGRLSRADAQRQLRANLLEGNVTFGSHFRRELAAENLDLAAAFSVLRSGTIFTEPELDIRASEWKYRVEGSEPGGKWLVIVFSFKSANSTFLITTFSVKERQK